MPALWRCEKCGFEDTFENLRETKVSYTQHFGDAKITRTCYALENELVEKRPHDEMDCVGLVFICPNCGHKEVE